MKEKDDAREKRTYIKRPGDKGTVLLSHFSYNTQLT